MIKQVWKSIGDIGVTTSVQNKTSAKISLLNKVALLILVASALNLSINIFGNTFRNGGALFTFGITLLIWYFNYRGRHDFAKHVMGFLFPLIIGFLMINNESNLAFTNILIVHIILCFILYEKNRKLLFLSVATICLVGVGTMLYIFKYNPDYYLDFNAINDFVLFGSAMLGLALLVSFYQNYILQAVNQQKSLLAAIKNKNAELERFAYVTSHDLKEPVRNIENLSKFIGSSISNQSYLDRNIKMTGMIKESSVRMSSLIDSILSYAKLDTKDLPVEKVELNDVINQFRISHVNTMRDMNAILICDNLPSIVANKTFISLLFQNLIENGFKYNTSNQPSVEISSSQSSHDIVIMIKDNGIGINEEFRSHIFEPFKRLHDNESYKGSGLGLSICRKIVEMHQGKIWVKSNPSGGSIFYVHLPVNSNGLS